MSKELAEKKCKPCEEGTPPLKGEELKALHDNLDNDWKVIDERYLEKTFKFDDFKQALAYTNSVGDIAEDEGHHPDIYLAWGEVTLKIWTHKINGLTESDFIFAAKADDAHEKES